MRTVLALACILTAAALPAAQSGHLIERDRLAKTHACDGCDLRSEDFGRADLKGVLKGLPALWNVRRSA